MDRPEVKMPFIYIHFNTGMSGCEVVRRVQNALLNSKIVCKRDVLKIVQFLECSQGTVELAWRVCNLFSSDLPVDEMCDCYNLQDKMREDLKKMGRKYVSVDSEFNVHLK